MKRDKFRAEYLKTMSQLATAGFGLVAALAWNDAIQTFINRIFPTGSGLVSKITYALLVTAIAVSVTYILGKMNQQAKNEEGDK